MAFDNMLLRGQRRGEWMVGGDDTGAGLWDSAGTDADPTPAMPYDIEYYVRRGGLRRGGRRRGRRVNAVRCCVCAVLRVVVKKSSSHQSLRQLPP